MAYVFLKGVREGVEIDNEDAKKAKGIWEDCCVSKKHFPIDLGNSTILTSEIKGIQLDCEEIDDGFEKSVAEYHKSRETLLKLSPKERAEKALPHFMLALQIFCGLKEITEEQRTFVLEKIQTFFENNPAWTIPSFRIYKPVFEKIGLREGGDKNDHLWEAGLRVLERSEEKEFEMTERKPINLTATSKLL